jgi:hypothetical protein
MLIEYRRYACFVAEEDEGELRVPHEGYCSPRDYNFRTMVTAHGVERQRPRFHHGYQVAFLVSRPPTAAPEPERLLHPPGGDGTIAENNRSVSSDNR